MEKCVQCGLPFPIVEKGYLFISINSVRLFELRKLLQNGEVLDENLLSIPYQSKAMLLRLVSTIETNIGNDVMTYVSRHNIQISRPMIPLTVLKERIEQEDIVEFIAKGKFISHFQPIIQLSDQSIYGYESLLRSGDANFNATPGQLFGVASKTGLFSLLDQKAREVAVKTRVNTIPAGVKSFINFLPSTIYNPEFCLRHTFSIVERYQVAPGDLVFEVVETEKIEDVDLLKRILQTYKASGMKVALDDVGTGFATLDMLKKLAPDYVKIDRQYISYCDQDKQKQDFLKQVMVIANGMGIKVLGEGIERQEELDYCRIIGMHLAQGFYIGKPSPKPVENILI
ncbi:EAL domain-containing protein [Radiobacillus sp. PE A8.2]|uniref:EAL domain-containing protein n=1 Tax=Radiobacillus sp. PE A8.2 TaxID=3380349 RepID=UPI00388F8E63